MKTAILPYILSVAPLLIAQTAPAPPTVARIFGGPVANAGREMISLAEAMPESAYNFAPKNGAFSDVRTFAQQAKHAGAVVYMVSAAILGEASPTSDENGPATVVSKAQVVQYLKDAFAFGAKAMQTMTAENQTQLVKSPFGSSQTSRGALASEAAWHTFDHYGQMVVYARMNNVVPPASMPQAPAPAQQKKK
jgi:hypothetical protein